LSQGLTLPEDEHYRCKTFLSECNAYDRAANHSLLRDHVPQFFGRFAVRDVIARDESIAHHYMKELCYAMQFIEGPARKLGPYLSGSLPTHIKNALSAFDAAGIHHYVDASVFWMDDPSRFTFIDFALEEFPPLR
jgi:hypothetical protein